MREQTRKAAPRILRGTLGTELGTHEEHSPGVVGYSFDNGPGARASIVSPVYKNVLSRTSDWANVRHIPASKRHRLIDASQATLARTQREALAC